MSRRRLAAALGSAAFFVLAPGVMAGLIPWLITDWRAESTADSYVPFQVLGWALLAASLAVLLGAFARFVIEGLGTPAPVAPTERLVIGGSYRYVRNPMYVAVASLIAGQALVFASVALGLYAVAFWAVVASFVRYYEEPTLRRRFGREYEDYVRAVPAWIPRLRAWRR